MRRAVGWLLVGAAAFTLGAAARVDADGRVPDAPRFVVLDSAPRAVLEAAWDDSDATQHERAYCVGYVASVRWGVPVWRVVQVRPARIDASTPVTVMYQCPKGPGWTAAHDHPPATCDDSTCVLGGPGAWQCEPSPLDRESLAESGAPFALLQCSRHAVVPYWRAGARGGSD